MLPPRGYVVAGVAQDLVDERRSSRLAVRAGDADRPGLTQVAARELHFGDDRNARFAEFDDQRRLVRNAGRLDDLVRREDPLFGVVPLLVGDLPLVQFGFVAVGDPPLVGEENVESFLLGEDRGAVAADAAAQDNYFFSWGYRILSVTRVMAASSSDTIQKRVTILVSKKPCFW